MEKGDISTMIIENERGGYTSTHDWNDWGKPPVRRDTKTFALEGAVRVTDLKIDAETPKTVDVVTAEDSFPENFNEDGFVAKLDFSHVEGTRD